MTQAFEEPRSSHLPIYRCSVDCVTINLARASLFFLIDRMLEVHAVDVYGVSTGITVERPNLPPDRIDRETIERI